MEIKELNTFKMIVEEGTFSLAAKKLIPSILNYLDNEKPYIHCDFVVGNTALLSQILEQNKIDFAVCGNNKNSSNMSFTPLYNEQIEFIVNNPHHPILHKESVEIFDIINYPVLIGENSCYYNQSVNAFLSENNLSFKRVYNCSALHLIPHMVFGNAIGIIPKGTILNKGNISFKVKGFDPQMPIGLLISSKNRNYLSQTKQQLMKLIESL